jgi:hypothetical protein
MNELSLYVNELEKLIDMQQKLVPIAAGLVHLKPAKFGSLEFSPMTNNISEQIRNWPNSIHFIPIDSWIEPSVGTIEFSNDTWEFSFQTQQVSFVNLRDKTYVRAEYSVRGDIGITPWVIRLFLEFSFKNGQIKEHVLVERSDEFFSYLIDSGNIKIVGDGPLGGTVYTYIP